MGKRASFTLRIDPELLEKFDDVAWSRRMRRSELIMQLIEKCVADAGKLPEGYTPSIEKHKSGRPKKTEEVKTTGEPATAVYDDDEDALYDEDDLM